MRRLSALGWALARLCALGLVLAALGWAGVGVLALLALAGFPLARITP